MTSIGRQAAIGLSTLLLAGTAGCVASPEYPIAPGQAPGDGGLHMSERPHYPISDAQSRAGVQTAPSASYPDQQRAPPPPAGASPPGEDADQPRAAPSAPVDSSSLPPPSQDGSSPDAGGPHMDYGLAQTSPVFALAAYRHRRHAAASDDQAAPDTSSKADEETKIGRRRHGKASGDADAAQNKTASADADSAAPPPLEVTVKSGERVSQIAKRLHISKQALMQVNGIDPSDHVKPGTVLKTPYRYAYQVQKGDTLYAIGHRFGEDTQQLVRLNALRHVTELRPGETLQLPVAAQDEGARDHAHGDALTPVGAPDRLIAEQLRKARRAVEREMAKEDRRARRGRRDAELAQADAPAASEPAVSEPEKTASRHRRFVPPPTELTSANLAPSIERPPVRIASRDDRPSAAMVTTASASSQTPSEPRVTPPYTPATHYTAPVSTASGSRSGDGASSVVTTRPPVSVASEMAAEAGPGLASTAARPSLIASETHADVLPSSTYATRPAVVANETSLTSPSRPLAAASTLSLAPYRRPTTVAPSYAAPSYAAPPSRRAEAGTSYAGSSYTGSAGTGAPTRVASLNTPTYGGSIYGGPVLGRPRPVVPSATGALTNAAIAAAGQGRFVWPLRGAILAPFGDHGEGLRNDGLDIVAQPGESVHAAAGGEVVYAGSSIPGFGNLILVKHAGGWVTAYAHLDRIEVRMRDTVAQGQEIGQAGQTGAVNRPQLHFEIRYAPQADEKARPVDPTLVLPGSG